MKRNYILEDRIKEYVGAHPGLMRRQIARGLQKQGVNLGQQHISNRAGELITLGQLEEQITEDGRRLVFPQNRGSHMKSEGTQDQAATRPKVPAFLSRTDKQVDV
ncbi:MAG: hypothetical protein M0Q91_15440 [Methanoregula sp.]|nr:hypothetical protein [Methanoregula sp.]